MINTTNKNSKNKNFFLIIIFSILLVAAASYFILGYTTRSLWPFSDNAAPQNNEVRGVNDVDYSPPNEQEVEDSQVGKENSIDQDNPNAQENKPTTPVAISFADVINNQVEIRAFIPGVLEGTGTCTATLVKNGRTITNTSKGFIDSTSTQCPPMYIALSSFPETGSWDLTVNYTSPTTTGKSELIRINL